MKVLLTGATGFLGSKIARELLRAGHEVRILVRKTSRLDNIQDLPLERAEGDISERASVERALEGSGALIHTAASVGHRLRDKETVWRSNVEGTRTVFEAALAAGIKRVVHTSSIAAVGMRARPELLHEGAEWGLENAGVPEYVKTKRKAEEIALDFVRRGLPVVILNPGFILGPGDLYLNSTRLILEFMRGPGRFYVDGGISACDVRDVARAHVVALERGRPGERYILAGQNVTLRELLETAARLTGLPRPIRLPYGLAYFGAALSELAAALFPHRLEELNRPVLRMARRFSFMDVSKARRELGYEPRPIEASLRDTIRFFLDRGLFEAKTPELKEIAAGAPGPEREPEKVAAAAP
jgi:dihydroflavonol-4-reductase